MGAASSSVLRAFAGLVMLRVGGGQALQHFVDLMEGVVRDLLHVRILSKRPQSRPDNSN
jgi:hypothetical protein